MPSLSLRTVLSGLLLGCCLGQPAVAFRLPPVSHQATLAECTACHMVFPPQMLPVRSWNAIIADLGHHFGEIATVAPDVKDDIRRYLSANSADAPANRKIAGLLQGVKPNDVPLRITGMPWWRSIHGDPGSRWFSDPRVKSAANCAACHRAAGKGLF